MSNKNIDLNKISLSNAVTGNERIAQIMNMPINGVGFNFVPKPISYMDVDTAMVEFASKNMSILFGDNEIKTFFFAPQRMSEFTKTWEMVDENNNVLPNFKLVTRENNPRPGDMHDGHYTIPGDLFYTIATFDKWDGGKKITVSYKMKQPYCVDIIYNIKFITNRLSLINEMNNRVNDEFKSKQSYINVNGYYMRVTLEDITDDSEYDLDKRKILVQTFQLKVAAFIINEKDILVQENPVTKIVNMDIDTTKPYLQPINNNDNIVIEFPRKARNVMSFKNKVDCHIVNVSVADDNVLSYIITVNNQVVGNDFHLKKYDNIRVTIERVSKIETSKITLIKG